MRWVACHGSRVPQLRAFLGALSLCLVSATAAAQVCEGSRPTDPGGSQGLAYASAEVTFFDSSSGRVRVHYALSGSHAPPAAATLEPDVPDAVVVAAEAAEAALDRYAELGYEPPLSDGDSPCASNGDSDAVDIYLVNFAAADGQAVPDHCQAQNPRRCAGFVMVDNDFRGGAYADVAEGMRTVVPHELFHLVQDAYDTELERWWAEGSAQWAAKRVYPELRDLERFLPAYFDNPGRPLNVPPPGPITSFLYATAIWPVFLQERFDADVLREVFEGLDSSQESVLETTDRVLHERGSSLAQEYLWFAAYNSATGERAPETGGYQAALDYPLAELTPVELAAGDEVDDTGAGLGSYYYAVSSEAPLQLELDADPERTAALFVPLVDGRAQLSDATSLPAVLDGPAIVVVAGQSLSRTNASFVLRAAEAGVGSAAGGAAGDDGGDDALDSSGCALRPGGTREAAPGQGLLLGLLLFSGARFRARPDTQRKRKDG